MNENTSADNVCLQLYELVINVEDEFQNSINNYSRDPIHDPLSLEKDSSGRSNENEVTSFLKERFIIPLFSRVNKSHGTHTEECKSGGICECKEKLEPSFKLASGVPDVSTICHHHKNFIEFKVDSKFNTFAGILYIYYIYKKWGWWLSGTVR
jgi:hypothetical protein